MQYPIDLPDGTQLLAPHGDERKRHVVIVGPPDCGKSYWLNRTFNGLSIYLRPNDERYPFDSYEGEEVVVYDDVFPQAVGELIDVCNTWWVPKQVYGSTRYRNKFWPKGQARLVIIICNSLSQLPYARTPVFTSRFRVIRFPDAPVAQLPEPEEPPVEDEKGGQPYSLGPPRFPSVLRAFDARRGAEAGRERPRSVTPARGGATPSPIPSDASIAHSVPSAFNFSAWDSFEARLASPSQSDRGSAQTPVSESAEVVVRAPSATFSTGSSRDSPIDLR